jgi:hypothetical protein
VRHLSGRLFRQAVSSTSDPCNPHPSASWRPGGYLIWKVTSFNFACRRLHKMPGAGVDSHSVIPAAGVAKLPCVWRAQTIPYKQLGDRGAWSWSCRCRPTTTTAKPWTSATNLLQRRRHPQTPPRRPNCPASNCGPVPTRLERHRHQGRQYTMVLSSPRNSGPASQPEHDLPCTQWRKLASALQMSAISQDLDQSQDAKDHCL